MQVLLKIDNGPWQNNNVAMCHRLRNLRVYLYLRDLNTTFLSKETICLYLTNLIADSLIVGEIIFPVFIFVLKFAGEIDIDIDIDQYDNALSKEFHK